MITDRTLTSEFETSVPILPGLPLIVAGTIVSTADIESKSETSWTLYMDKVRIKESSSNIPFLNKWLDNFDGLPIRSLGGLLEKQSLVDYTNPRPIFRTLYVDTHMKICRDQDDNVFVYNRVESE